MDIEPKEKRVCNRSFVVVVMVLMGAGGGRRTFTENKASTKVKRGGVMLRDGKCVCKRERPRAWGWRGGGEIRILEYTCKYLWGVIERISFKNAGLPLLIVTCDFVLGGWVWRGDG